MSEKTKPQDCPHWIKGCSAPLCPLENNLEQAVWYPDEDICRSTKHAKGKAWIAKQRKVAKQAERTDQFFNVRTLSRDFVVRKGVLGVDPDSEDIEAAIKRWFRDHPARKKKSPPRKRTVKTDAHMGG